MSQKNSYVLYKNGMIAVMRKGAGSFHINENESR